MHRLSLIFLGLTACTPPIGPPSAVPFRTVQTQIYSTANMPASRLIGRWRQVADFGAGANCTPRGIDFSVQNGAVQVAYHLCINGRAHQGAGPLAGRQGRYILPGFAAPVWVLWMDGGNRSMAIGTPDGSIGMILSKDKIPDDRWQAARDILAWNGYDLAQIYSLR